MTREEKCKLAIERGYKYDPETGYIYWVKGKKVDRKNTNGYICFSISINGKKHYIQGHHFAWYWVHKSNVEIVDHINRDKTDNRISNLRKSNKSLNATNNNAKGYTYRKSEDVYIATIKKDYKSIHLGYYKNKEDARAVYLKAKNIILNNPNLNRNKIIKLINNERT